jgi:hypothetical protein
MDVERIIDEIEQLQEMLKRRILDHSAQSTSLLQIDGTTIYSRTARGFGSGSSMASAAVPSPQYSDWAK